MDNLTGTMKKLLELSKRGVDGEKENAEKLLRKMMKKYNISEADLEKDDIHVFEIAYKTDIEKKLALQVFYKVTKSIEYGTYRNSRKKRVILSMTDAQYIEFVYQLEIYKNAWEENLGLLMEAFIAKNDIFPKLTKEEEKELKKKTNQEDNQKMDLNKLRKIQMMSMGLDYTSVNKAIGNK